MPRATGAGRRRPGSSPAVWVTGLLAGATVVVIGAALARQRAAHDAVTHRPHAALPRLTEWPSFTAPGVHAVHDFEWVGERLYLLDTRDAHVAVLQRDADGHWRERLRIAARGSGPGELERPGSVAEHNDGRIAVLDGDRLHTYTADGTPLDTRELVLPCLARRGVLATLAGDALYLAATCVDGAPGSDTVSALLWRLAVDGPEELARAPRFTRDARWGNAYTTDRVLAAGPGRLLFGSGLDACVRVVSPGADAPVVRCAPGTQRYRSAAPAELAALERMPKELVGRAWRWSDALPYFHDLAAPRSADVLIRLWSPDSVVLQTATRAGATAHDLLVAPFNGLVGCRSGGCLWRVGDDVDGVRLIALELRELERLIGRAGDGTAP